MCSCHFVYIFAKVGFGNVVISNEIQSGRIILCQCRLICVHIINMIEFFFAAYLDLISIICDFFTKWFESQCVHCIVLGSVVRGAN